MKIKYFCKLLILSHLESKIVTKKIQKEILGDLDADDSDSDVEDLTAVLVLDLVAQDLVLHNVDFEGVDSTNNPVIFSR